MPSKTEKRGKKYAAVTPSGRTLGTHATKKEAQAQAFAVNVSEGLIPGVRPRKKAKKGK